MKASAAKPAAATASSAGSGLTSFSHSFALLCALTLLQFPLFFLRANDTRPSHNAHKGDKGAEAAHTPTAQFNHYDNPKATKAAGCPKKWQHPAEKGSRPYVIPQGNKSTLEMETEGDESPRWSRSRRSNSNFANSGSTMVEKTYFFSGEELHGDVKAFCVALSPRMAMDYASEEIKFS